MPDLLFLPPWTRSRLYLRPAAAHNEAVARAVVLALLAAAVTAG
jgi:hypothetical protein